MKLARRSATLSLFLFLLAMQALAADWPTVSPEELSMTSIKEQPGAPAVILLREETDDDVNSAHMVYERIKILTDAGRRYADVELAYNGRWFNIEGISGRTVHPDGSIVQFEGKPFDKVVAKGNGIHVSVKSFTLPDVQVGSIIDFRYSLRYGDRFSVPPVWLVQTDLFQKKAYFKFIPFQNHNLMYLKLDHGQRSYGGVAWTSFLPKGPQPELHEKLTSSVAGHDTTSWVDLSLNDIPAFVEEPFMPPPNMIKRRVYFYYQENLKPDDYWKAEGKFWNKEVEEFVGKRKGIDEALAKVISASDKPEQKVSKIYAFVLSLENQDYIPRRTTQEEKVLEIKITKGAEDVLEHRSGRHDELNRLFVSMVRASGIPASLIRVPDRSREIFIKELLTIGQFDAEVAIVQLDGKDVFLDPGTKFCPYGIVNWRYAGVEGLRQGPNGAYFAKTPQPTYGQSITTRMANVSLDEHGVLTGTASLAFKGIAAMHHRQEGYKTDAEGRKKLLEDELRSMMAGNTEVTLSNVPDWDNAETPLVAQFHISGVFGATAGKRMMLPQHLFQVNEKARFSVIERNNPIYFHTPWQEADEVHIKIPAGMEIETMAPDDVVKLSYALYQSRQKQESPDRIFSRRDLVMGVGLFSTAEYKEVKGFFDKVKADDDQPTLVRLSSVAATK
jgi:Transglutaminase-like superfamily.